MIYKYAHPEWFEGWDKPELEKLSGNIVLWGAGKIGGVAAHCLKKRGVEFKAFCDVAKDKWGTEFCGHKVISPLQLKDEYPNATVLISAVFHRDIAEQLKKAGFTGFFDCTFLFTEIDFDDYDCWMEIPYAIRNVEQYMASIHELKTSDNSIDQLFMNITTKCTLRCKDCSQYIPYVASPKNYDADIIMEDFYKILNAVGHIRIVNFYGGEPLLHPKLAEMIKLLKNESRIDRITSISNGTILPSKELLEAMRDDKRFYLRISDYGSISTKLDELIKMLDENKIQYEVANYTYWDRISQIGPVTESNESLTEKFIRCTACNVLFNLDRKVYLCSTASAVCTQKGFPPSADNYVDLSRFEKGDEAVCAELLNYIKRRNTGEFLNACHYCTGNHCVQFEEKLPVAEQTKELLKFPKYF